MTHLKGGEAMKKIGFIGAGKVACQMGKYFSENGIPVTGYTDISASSADEAATYTGTKVFGDTESLISCSDVIFISTPDDVIKSIWDEIKSMDIDRKMIGIFSGSLSTDLFSGAKDAGASVVSAHPMYAFSDRFSDYRKLHTASFTVEGDEDAVSFICELFKGLGHRVAVIDSAKKMRYHAAASIASNLMIGLYDISLSMLKDTGFSDEDAVSFLSPLVLGNISSALESSPAAALTGPIERGDTDTVRHHLEVLTSEERDVYLPLAKRLLMIAREKNPERDYSSMERLLLSTDL